MELNFFVDMSIVYAFLLIFFGFIYGMVFLIFGVIVFLTTFYGIIFLIVLSLIFIFLVLSELYSIYEIIYIKRNIKKLKTYSVNFGKAVDWTFWVPGYYYNILVELEDGSIKPVKTTAMFSKRSPVPIYYPRKMYNDRKMMVAYDPKKNKVIVLNYVLEFVSSKNNKKN